MRLTKFTDYALRVLILAASRNNARVTIEEAATLYGVSLGHLKKVVMALARSGFLQCTKGRTGGFTLARRPEEISLGAVIRATEHDFTMFDCASDGKRCTILGPCGLPAIGRRATQAFLAAFDQATLADVMLPQQAFTLPTRLGGTQPFADS